MEINPLLEKIETEVCSRCGGGGRYSWCQTHGDRCFKCYGKGKVYTPRGLVAHNYLNTLRSKPASEVVAGDVVRYEDVLSGARKFVKITAARTTEPGETGWIEANGVRTPIVSRRLEWSGHVWGVSPDELIRIAQTAEQKVATLKKALEYQATLTKKGEPRK